MTLKGGPVTAVIADSESNEWGRRAGHGGIASLTHERQPENLFAPDGGGLMRIFDGAAAPRSETYEAERGAAELGIIGPDTIELYRPASPPWKLAACTRFAIDNDGVILQTFECIARKRTFRSGSIGLSWESYIAKPDSAVAGVRRNGPPFYFAASRGMAYLQVFRPEDRIEFTQSAAGAGASMWTYQWFIPQYELGRVYRLESQIAYVPFRGKAYVEDLAERLSLRWSKDPAFTRVQDKPGLPRVLLIGDSISIGYTLAVRRLLEGKANVHRIANNAADTERGLRQLQNWLGNQRWDVIHFNWGLHDLKRVSDTETQVPLEQYERNLRRLVQQLKATGAKLIWASTTPVPEAELSPRRKTRDAIVYNEAASRIMRENGIPIDDLYSLALPRLQQIQRPANVHFTETGSELLGAQVAESIRHALAQRKP